MTPNNADASPSQGPGNNEAKQVPALLSRKLLNKHIQKLHLSNGDVLTVKAGTGEAKKEILQGVAEALGKVGKKDIIIVVVDDHRDLRALNEKEMNALGWFRVPALSKLIHSKADALAEQKEERKESTDEPHGD